MKGIMQQRSTFVALLIIILFGLGSIAMGQTDQGTITGVVQDPSGSVIPNASVTLTGLDNGQVLNTTSNETGVYSFPPVRIGSYSVTATSPGFAKTTQTNIKLGLQERLNVIVTLNPGATSETVTVTGTESVMQSQEASVGQVITTTTLNNIPLSAGNWTYAAQLSAGTVPSVGTRGNGTGDFNSNGQRAEQNNYILNGVDNNVDLVDFPTGASYGARPPTEALAEFKVQTADYSAEFGHSAGAVINASLKSGSNSVHGSLWEHVRNTAFDARNWNATSIPAYHENQFGGTIGLPIIRNKLFFFGDVQANRISYAATSIASVPTLKMRAGDFSELLSPSLTGQPAPVQLYYQDHTLGPQAFPNNNMATGIHGVAPNATALAVLNMYPKPTPNYAPTGQTYNNYYFSTADVDNTAQFDTRIDWNIASKDTMYTSFSYWNEPSFNPSPLGALEGGGSTKKDIDENFMLAEAHVFSPTLANSFRVGYNYIHGESLQIDANDPTFASKVGFGGIPGGPNNGGLPGITVSGMSSFGAGGYSPTNERENVYQIIDNVTKIIGNHSLEAGVSFQSIRFATLQPVASRGTETYNGVYTSNLNAASTGWGVADFLLDSQNSASLSNLIISRDARWYNAAFAEDNWRVNQKLAINLGVRWEYYQPYKELGGNQANYSTTGPSTLNTTTGYGSGSAQYIIPNQGKAYAQGIFTATSNLFPNLLAKDNITLGYTDSPAIVTAQKTNFGPRVGLSYALDANTVVRAGYGLFYGGLENEGYYGNLSENYPFQYESTFPAASCNATYCPTNGITIANGFNTVLANGFANNVSFPAMRGGDPAPKTPYSQDFNLSVERNLSKGIYFTLGYVGSNAHHLFASGYDPNAPLALENPGNSTQNARPFPDFSGSSYISDPGSSNYNGMIAKLEKRYSDGISLLASYTWSHARDDAPPMLTTTNLDNQYREPALIPIKLEYGNSSFDTRQRIAFNASYELPFGLGRKFLNQNRVLDYLVGGWSADTQFSAQTGNPFTVYESGISKVSGAQGKGIAAVKVKDPYASGGTFTSTNPNIHPTCATSTRNRKNWYNPCSFENPWNPNDWTDEPQHYIPLSTSDPHYAAAQQPIYVTSLQSAQGFLGDHRNEIYGPGYERINESVFKNFKVYREQTLQFRADAFNLFNTPSLAQPTDFTIDSTGGQITTPRSFQSLTPDARFFELSMMYSF
jgi:hypothetical protein